MLILSKGLALACVTVLVSTLSIGATTGALAAGANNRDSLHGTQARPASATSGHFDLSTLLKGASRARPLKPGAKPSTPTIINGTPAGTDLTGSAYTALPPRRLLDTRVTGQTLTSNETFNLTVVGGSVPADATAVVLNVTITDTNSWAWLAVHPAARGLNTFSNLNWVPGQTVPNLVIVPVGLNGQVSFYNSYGNDDLVVDLEGYFAPEVVASTNGSYVALSPHRITDTRTGSGEPYAGDTLGPDGSLNIQVDGMGGVPASGVSAALLNVTVTDTSAMGFLTVYPAGGSRPLASNLNWNAGVTVANRVLVPVSASGQITVFNNSGNTDVVVDVDGYFTDGSVKESGEGLYFPLAAARIVDTRLTGQTLGPGTTFNQPMVGHDSIPATATAVITNVTATDTTAGSFFTVFPGGSWPLASDVNWQQANQTVPNLTVATLGGNGSIDVFNAVGKADLVIDAFGYFAPPPPVEVSTTFLPEGTLSTAYSATLGATGGTPPYTWVLASGSLPAGLTLSSGGVISGTPSANGSSTFTVQVTDSSSPVETATASITLTVGTTTGTPAYTQNWSGYVLTGGPFTQIQGTFNVPNLAATPTDSYASEWVGIDGALNTSLIQTGIAEYYSAAAGYVYFLPWWEILPYPAVNVPIMVLPGDRITASIDQAGATSWTINLVDDTSGATFSTTQSYSAPQSSAEWIMEAPTVNGAQTTLGVYSPDVNFTGLSDSGSVSTTYDTIMVQNGTQVSTPSPLTASGFAVAYGSVAPSAP